MKSSKFSCQIVAQSFACWRRFFCAKMPSLLLWHLLTIRKPKAATDFRIFISQPPLRLLACLLAVVVVVVVVGFGAWGFPIPPSPLNTVTGAPPQHEQLPPCSTAKMARTLGQRPVLLLCIPALIILLAAVTKASDNDDQPFLVWPPPRFAPVFL